MTDSRNFIIAIALSMGVLLLWQVFIAGPQMEEERARLEAERAAQAEAAASGSDLPVAAADGDTPIPQGAARGGAPGSGPAAAGLPREAALGLSPRIRIETPAVTGSLSLTGARIDDLKLKRYRDSLDEGSPIITLLSPRESDKAYYAEVGWTALPGADLALPDRNTLWTALSDAPLTPENPVQLFWENGQGQRFDITYSIDENYLITVEQSVTNEGGEAVTVFPYGVLARQGLPPSEGFWILHEGFLGVFGDALEQITYKKTRDEPFEAEAPGGWLGMTDKYWMAAFAPAEGEGFKGRFRNRTLAGGEEFRVDYLLDGRSAAPGTSTQATVHLFAGAKKVDLLEGYQETHNIERFDLAVDWGWFFFLTKPFFHALNFLAQMTGNFGVAILLFTIGVKLVFFPLANKSYEAMSKMKKVQPEMMKIRDRYKDDKMKQQQELMDLYKREKVNPLAGCLPMVIQIPVFFSLYKVLFVTIEMRHAPFFGWIQDLSAPDPTTIFNLFGLLPYDPSVIPVLGPLLMIGVWPIIMGITMWLQMQMNPQPTDEIQKAVFAWMPLIFTIMLASFSAGLVIYWAWNNALSILQQYVIMRRMGVEPEWKKNLKLPSWVPGASKGGEDTARAEPLPSPAGAALSDKDKGKEQGQG